MKVACKFRVMLFVYFGRGRNSEDSGYNKSYYLFIDLTYLSISPTNYWTTNNGSVLGIYDSGDFNSTHIGYLSGVR